MAWILAGNTAGFRALDWAEATHASNGSGNLANTIEYAGGVSLHRDGLPRKCPRGLGAGPMSYIRSVGRCLLVTPEDLPSLVFHRFERCVICYPKSRVTLTMLRILIPFIAPWVVAGLGSLSLELEQTPKWSMADMTKAKAGELLSFGSAIDLSSIQTLEGRGLFALEKRECIYTGYCKAPL